MNPGRSRRWLCGIAVALTAAATSHTAPTAAADALPSWNDTPAKAAIVDFVRRVTRDGSADFVLPAERIAVFDNDGTLWAEQPIYFQLAFALDRVKALAPQHPEWKDTQPFKGVLEGDARAVAASGERGLLEILAATHAGTTTEEFERIVLDCAAIRLCCGVSPRWITSTTRRESPSASTR